MYSYIYLYLHIYIYMCVCVYMCAWNLDICSQICVWYFHLFMMVALCLRTCRLSHPQVPPRCHPGATQVPQGEEHPKDRPKEKQRKEFLLGLTDISSEAIARSHQHARIRWCSQDMFGHVWTMAGIFRYCKPIQKLSKKLLTCRYWLLMYGVIVRGFSSMNGKWVFLCCCLPSSSLIILFERQRRGHWLWQPPRTGECFPHFTTIILMSDRLLSPFRCLNITTSQYSAQGRGRPWRAIAEIEAVRKNMIDWYIETHCRECSMDVNVRKLWLVICCHWMPLHHIIS